jgi:hypothetical protein
VHAWTPDVPADHEAVCGPRAAAEERACLTVLRALEPWSGRFPDVRVETRLTHADPADALIRESEGAALLVVAARVHGAARATIFGSVSRRVAQRARCPVVVVRSATARTATTRRARHVQPGRRTPIADRVGRDEIRRGSTAGE